MNLKKSSIFLAVGLSLFTACKKDKDAMTPPPPVKVTVEVVSPYNSEAGRSYTGTVNAETTTSVSFAVPGTITRLNFSEGQKVAKGQVLGTVRNADYANSYNMAQAELAEAQDAYERMKKLHDANALPDIKWVEIQQKLKQAENAAEISKRALDDATLISPVTGVVNRKLADVGQNVMPVEPVYEIVSADNLTIDISVPENEIGKIKVGDPVKVIFNDKSLGEKDCKVTMKAVVADPLTRAYTVKIAVPSEKGQVLAGMLGTVQFKETTSPATDSLYASKAVASLPTQAVLLDFDNRNFVWVVKNSKATRRFVVADELVTNGVLVTSGLEHGDSVIIAGMQKVSEGTPVAIDNKKASGYGYARQ